MVTRITGMADHHALEFVPAGEYWEARVPPDIEDGTYYVTMTAWDAAGNSTYYATVLMTVDVTGIRFAWQDGDYVPDWISGYGASWRDDLHQSDWLPGHVAAWGTGYCADWEGC